MHRQQQQSQDDLLTLILNTLVQFWPIPVMMIAVNLLGMAWYWGLLAGLTVYAIFFGKMAGSSINNRNKRINSISRSTCRSSRACSVPMLRRKLFLIHLGLPRKF